MDDMYKKNAPDRYAYVDVPLSAPPPYASQDPLASQPPPQYSRRVPEPQPTIIELPPPSCGYESVKFCLLFSLGFTFAAVILITTAFTLTLIAATNGHGLSTLGNTTNLSNGSLEILHNNYGLDTDHLSSDVIFSMATIFYVFAISKLVLILFELSAVRRESFKRLVQVVVIEAVIMMTAMLVKVNQGYGFRGPGMVFILLVIFTVLVRQRDQQKLLISQGGLVRYVA
jgi:hypothetical protein